MEYKNLYRALRKEEISAGNILIPKVIKPFKNHPRMGIDTHLPFMLGEQEEYAVRQHQWKQEGFPGSSGVSTTPHIERARFYAKNEVIVVIDREQLKKFNINEYVVKDYLKKYPEDIAVPKDDEIILFSENGNFPREVIVKVINGKVF